MFRLEDEFRSLVERSVECFDLTHEESTHLDCSNEDDFGEEDADVKSLWRTWLQIII